MSRLLPSLLVSESETASPPRRARFLAALRETVQADSRETRLVISHGPVYVLTVARHDGRVVQEAITSASLPPELKLSSERGQLLRDMGFKKRGSSRRNWTRALERAPSNVERIAEELDDIFTRVYGIDGQPDINLVRDQRVHPENVDLVDAMRKVAKDRAFDEDTRRGMYTRMLNATFLVPLDPEVGDDADEADAFFDLKDHPSGRPTLAGFSDWDSLRLWQPRGWDYVPVHGSELFELVQERNAATFKINPGGDIGGELYAHEVEMLVNAVHTFRRKHGN